MESTHATPLSERPVHEEEQLQQQQRQKEQQQQQQAVETVALKDETSSPNTPSSGGGGGGVSVVEGAGGVLVEILKEGDSSGHAIGVAWVRNRCAALVAECERTGGGAHRTEKSVRSMPLKTAINSRYKSMQPTCLEIVYLEEKGERGAPRQPLGLLLL